MIIALLEQTKKCIKIMAWDDASTTINPTNQLGSQFKVIAYIDASIITILPLSSKELHKCYNLR